MSTFDERAAKARKHIRAMKKVAPYIYPQHGRMLAAKEKLEKAKKEYAEALALWKALGAEK